MVSNINQLFVTVSLIGGKATTDLYITPIDSHQYPRSSSCHQYHCKKAISYSQVLCLNRICSNPKSISIPIQCQHCFLYVGSTKSKFRYRINSYKSTHRKFRKKCVVNNLTIVIKKSE